MAAIPRCARRRNSAGLQPSRSKTKRQGRLPRRWHVEVRRVRRQCAERGQLRYDISLRGFHHLGIQPLVQAEQRAAAQGVDPIRDAGRQAQLHSFWRPTKCFGNTLRPRLVQNIRQGDTRVIEWAADTGPTISTANRPPVGVWRRRPGLAGVFRSNHSAWSVRRLSGQPAHGSFTPAPLVESTK